MKESDYSKPSGKIATSADRHVTFIPDPLPPYFHYDNELINLLSKAEQRVGELKGMGELLENPEMLIAPYLRKEAVFSSKIEGTLASIHDVLQHEAVGGIKEQESEHLRLHEVINYIETLQKNLNRIKNGKAITLEMIKQAHKTLLSKVRGSTKNLGEFRQVQNWIVKYGENVENPTYTPPPPEHLNDLLQNLESFLQSPPKNMPVLIQSAIAHYQFEAIHPFEDGNGRIGRILVALLLAQKGILPQPLLYLSAYFEQNRKHYYAGLLAISQKSKWKEWLKFFLTAVIVQAEKAIKNIHQLMILQKKYRNTLREQHASGSVILLLDRIFENPYMTIPAARDYLKVTYPTAKNTVQILVKAGILEEISGYSKRRSFLAKEILEHLEV